MGKVRCFAVGYQGRSLEGLCALLAEHRVDTLVDVRERAWSNRPEFRKTALANALSRWDIEYLHVREAGNPFRPRMGEVMSAVDCMKRYRGYLRSAPGVIERLRALVVGRRIALLCYEAKSGDCHRGVLLASLQRKQPGLAVEHL